MAETDILQANGVKPNSFECCYDNAVNSAVSEEFCKSLIRCCEFLPKDGNSDTTTPFTQPYSDTFIFTVFPPGVLTPFSKLVGSHQRKTLIVSRQPEVRRDKVAEESANSFDRSLVSVGDNSSLSPLSSSPFTTCSLRYIATSHPLKQRRAFLGKEEHLLPTSRTTTLTIATDDSVEPVPTDLARYLCSMLSVGCSCHPEMMPALPDVWIPCHGGPRKFIAFGCCFDPSHPSPQHRLRLCTVSEAGSFTVPSSSTPVFKLETVCPSKWLKSTPQLKRKRRVRHGYAEYELGLLADESAAQHPQLVLQFAWESVMSTFSLPPENADAVLQVRAYPGNQFSPVLDIFSEIDGLLELSHSISSQHQWPEREDILNAPSTIVDRVQTFLEDASLKMVRAMEVTMISPTAQTSPFQPRDDLDFTEQLWMFTRHVTSSAELIGVLEHVCEAVLLRKLQPYIHHGKQSTLANLFRQSLSASNHDQRQVVASKLQSLLTEEKALGCLVEIGVEKMWRDYSSFFISNSLATASQLEEFFPHHGDPLSQQVHLLCNLHCVLELAAVAMTFLTLPQLSLSQLTRQALDFYRGKEFVGFLVTPIFLLPFPALSQGVKCLMQCVSSLKPIIWSLSVDGMDLKQNRKVAVCSSEPLFKFMAAPEEIDEEEGAAAVMYVYHCDSMLI